MPAPWKLLEDVDLPELDCARRGLDRQSERPDLGEADGFAAHLGETEGIALVGDLGPPRLGA